MNYRRLIIVSNRLPYKPVKDENNAISLEVSSGGLVSSIKSYLQKINADNKPESRIPTYWLGSLTEGEFQLVKDKRLNDEHLQLIPLFIPENTYSKYYNGFCNSTIWPLFHYFPSYAHYKNDEYEKFVAVNRIFAEKIKEVYKPGDLIWVHDYHLMLLPGMIRESFPDASIGFFLHIPFPSFELFRLLPNKWRKEILQGILGADLIGFHTNDYVQYFIKSVRQVLGYESMMRNITTSERTVIIDTFPVSIDFSKFNGCSSTNEAFSERNSIRKTLTDKKIIISVDRLDYSKGLINRLEGFQTFIENYPGYKGKVTYMLLMVPSRDVIPKYQKNKRNIEELISRINGKYGNIDWTPIIYQYRNLNFNQLGGLYLAADAALITPIRDGMNLVAKEFVAARADRRGVLILSETAGAAAELGEALIINPTDRTEIADAIKTAIEMPFEEQIERMETMQKRIKNYDVVKWAEDFLTQLTQFKKMQEKLKVKEISAIVENEIQQKYESANRRLLLLDYDGTLAPLKALPHQAVPSEELIELLEGLSKEPKNKLVIISGRPANVLQKWFGRLNLDLVAEHGAFYKLHGHDWVQSIDVDSAWKSSVLSTMDLFTERCAGTFIEEKQMSIAWHYRNAEQELAFLRSRELINSLLEIAPSLNFQVIEGKKVIEARARGIDKGSAAARWLQEFKEEFILAAGDDKTDEDLFRIMPFGAYSIRIGLDQSIARFNYPKISDLIKLLRNFSQSCANVQMSGEA